ncbi:MAG: tetratricopeptide repeat protein [Candidatus Omnitrophica bacterium]|nr:tetratricopeptide repeat protein [Candidatus Omnitrophota bacterium]
MVEQAASERPNKIKLVLVILIACAAFSVYTNSFNGPFLFDDVVLVKDNPLIRDISNIPVFFKTDIFSHNPDAKPISNSYRPLQTATYAIDFFLWGKGPMGFHLGNLLFHIINAILVFLLIERLTRNRSLSFFVSLLFSIHPVNTQCVSYIAGRADLLVALFVFLSFKFYIDYSKVKRAPLLFLSAISYLFALYSKEAAMVILPLILFLYNVTFNKTERFKIRSYLLHISMLAVYLPTRLHALNGLAPRSLELSKIELFPRVLTSLKGLFIDLRILLLPHDLHFGRTTEVEYSLFGTAGSVLTVLGLLIFVYILRSTYTKWDKKKDMGAGIIFFGFSWFFVSMLPLLNIIPLQVFHSDNWLYLSSIGIYLAAGHIIWHAWRALDKRRIIFKYLIPLLVSAALLLYGYATVKRNGDYGDEIRFYLSSLRWRPNVKFYRVVGGLYGEKGDYENAVKHFKMGIETDKIYPSPEEVTGVYYNLGITYMRLSRFKEAEEALRKVLSSDNEALKKEASRLLSRMKK